MGSLQKFAMEEFRVCGWLNEDGTFKVDEEDGTKMQEVMCKGVLEVLAAFESQKHSGFSAGYAISMIQRLLKYQPLSALTGEDDEWTTEEGMKGGDLHQNRRCFHVFKENGQAYNGEAIVFRDADGATYINAGSRRNIEFPYQVPDKPEVQDRD